MGAGNKEHALSNKQRRVIRKTGRHRLFNIPRQPNGQPSRAKAHRVATEPHYPWLAPVITLELNMHPVDKLEQRGAITADQRAAAFAWIGDRMASGMPCPDPPHLDMERVRAVSNQYSDPSRAHRFKEASHILRSRCGVYGHTLAYEAIIQGLANKVVEDYFTRLDHKPMRDPTERQQLTWNHLRMAFAELEGYYAIQPKNRVAKNKAVA